MGHDRYSITTTIIQNVTHRLFFSTKSKCSNSCAIDLFYFITSGTTGVSCTRDQMVIFFQKRRPQINTYDQRVIIMN